MPEGCPAVIRVAARRVCSVRGCYQVALWTSVDPHAQSVAEKQGKGQNDVGKSATASFPRSQGEGGASFAALRIREVYLPKRSISILRLLRDSSRT